MFVTGSNKSPIFVFGSVNIDVSARLNHFPVPGETLHARDAGLGLGGKGANQAVAAARLGADVGLVGRTGDDPLADFAAAALRRHGVAPDGLYRSAADLTGLAMICTDSGGENTIVVVGGANMTIDATDIARLSPLLTPGAIVLMQCEIPMDTLRAAARAIAQAGARLILDPAPVPEDGLDAELFALAELMTPNETETERLTGLRPHDTDSARRAADTLHRLGLRRAIVKLGARGVLYSDASGHGFVPPFAVTPIDSTAAGDCFNGGLAVALSSGMDLAGATRYAAACGALATTRKGAAEAAPTRPEVEHLLATQPG
ncbi:ribokinase [Gluconacetobacter aggeris]|uniref:Ribokinase n=1 Tax=Gluconacetobacter aggeris TaxID=1286186 RepID=A0A7W4NW61_9PROT|nr:ribokinase [Gluconacetobacter aggeris]